MGTYLAALPLALLMLPAAAAAQAAPPPAAFTLARLLMTGEETLQNDEDVARIRTRIQNTLLSEPGACNSIAPGCISEARAAAQQFAPVFMRAELARRERINAFLLADTLTPDEMTRFAQYLGADGQKLLAAMIRLRQPDRNDRRRRELERSVEASAVPGAMAQARSQFRQRTRNMPAAPPR